MMIVRIKVAKCELMPSSPIFANIAVSAAKSADASAQATHVSMIFLYEMNYWIIALFG